MRLVLFCVMLCCVVCGLVLELAVWSSGHFLVIFWPFSSHFLVRFWPSDAIVEGEC